MLKNQGSTSQATTIGSRIQKKEPVNPISALNDVKSAVPAELLKGEGQKNSDANSIDLIGTVGDSSIDLDAESDITPQPSSLSRTNSFKVGSKATPTPIVSASEVSLEEKRRRRAERFGTAASSSLTPPKAVAGKPLSIEEELEKRRIRAERFCGGNTATDTTPTPVFGKNLAPSLKAISAIDEKEKLRLRAERFGIVNPSRTSKRKAPGAEKRNLGTPKSIPTKEAKQKLEARAKRFKLDSTTSLSPENAAKLAKRAARFAINKS